MKCKLFLIGLIFFHCVNAQNSTICDQLKKMPNNQISGSSSFQWMPSGNENGVAFTGTIDWKLVWTTEGKDRSVIVNMGGRFKANITGNIAYIDGSTYTATELGNTVFSKIKPATDYLDEWYQKAIIYFDIYTGSRYFKTISVTSHNYMDYNGLKNTLTSNEICEMFVNGFTMKISKVENIQFKGIAGGNEARDVVKNLEKKKKYSDNVKQGNLLVTQKRWDESIVAYQQALQSVSDAESIKYINEKVEDVRRLKKLELEEKQKSVNTSQTENAQQKSQSNSSDFWNDKKPAPKNSSTVTTNNSKSSNTASNSEYTKNTTPVTNQQVAELYRQKAEQQRKQAEQQKLQEEQQSKQQEQQRKQEAFRRTQDYVQKLEADTKNNVEQLKQSVNNFTNLIIQSQIRKSEREEAERVKKLEADRIEREKRAAEERAIREKQNSQNAFMKSIPAFVPTNNRADSILRDVYYFFIAQQNDQLFFSTPFLIRRYSDNTWPFKADIENKIGSVVNSNSRFMVGYFSTEEDAINMVNNLTEMANNSQFSTQTIKFTYKDYSSRNDTNTPNKTASQKDNFWKN